MFKDKFPVCTQKTPLKCQSSQHVETGKPGMTLIMTAKMLQIKMQMMMKTVQLSIIDKASVIVHTWMRPQCHQHRNNTYS